MSVFRNTLGLGAAGLYFTIANARQESTRIAQGGSLVEDIENAEYSMEMRIYQWSGSLALSNLPIQTILRAINATPFIGTAVQGAATSLGISSPITTNDITTFANQTSELSTVVSYRLPLPKNLVDSQTQKWQAESPTNLAEAFTSATVGQIPGATPGIRDLSLFAQVGAGYSVNEFLTQMFKGPEFKKYAMSWSLSPNTPQIASNVKSFLRQVNKCVAPRRVADGVYWEYPLIFQLFLYKGNRQNPNIYKFKPAVVNSFSVDYAGSGVPSFYVDGQPETVVVNMSFTELVYWSRDDYNDSW